MEKAEQVLNEKIRALATHLDEDFDIITHKEDNLFDYLGREYLVLTDQEAQVMAIDYIRESLWAFRASFLSYFACIESDEAELVFTTLQEKHCEFCNEAIYALVKDRFSDLVEDAISSDGRGHYIPGSYDHEENEVRDYYIYRIS